MKNSKKLIAILLSILMLFSALPVMAFAAGSYTVSLSAPADVVKGEMFEVQVKVTSSDTSDSVAALQTNITYDSSKVEFASVSPSVEAAYNSTTGALAVYGASKVVGSGGAVMATLTFRALNTVGNTAFTINGTPKLGVSGSIADITAVAGAGVTVNVTEPPETSEPKHFIAIGPLPADNFEYELFVNGVKLTNFEIKSTSGSGNIHLYRNAAVVGDSVMLNVRALKTGYAVMGSGGTLYGTSSHSEDYPFSRGYSYPPGVPDSNAFAYTATEEYSFPNGSFSGTMLDWDLGINLNVTQYLVPSVVAGIEHGSITAEAVSYVGNMTNIKATATPEIGYRLDKIEYSMNGGNSWVPFDNIVGNIGTTLSGGGGTMLVKAAFAESSGIEIYTEDDLFAFANRVSGGSTLSGVAVNLMNDITLTRAWTPIGTYSVPFSGVFDGGNHKISGLTAGLFGNISGATIKDLTLYGEDRAATSTTGVIPIGGFVYDARNASVLMNCVNYMDLHVFVANGPRYAGGIVGRATNSQITGCANYGTITASGSDTESPNIAGIAYSTSGGRIENCVNYGDIFTDFGTSAGVVNEAGNNATIESSVNKGSVRVENPPSETYAYTAGGTAAGIVARTTGGTTNITNCYNTGAISVHNTEDADPAFVAGILGFNGVGYITVMTNCYNSGALTRTGLLADADHHFGEIHVLKYRAGDKYNGFTYPDAEPPYYVTNNCYTSTQIAANVSNGTAVSKLGNAYVADNNGVNQGNTPLLSWESRDVDNTKYTATFSITGPAESAATIKVFTDNTKQNTVTAIDGAYKLLRGSYPYEITAQGYATATGFISIVASDTTVSVSMIKTDRITFNVTPATANISVVDAVTGEAITVISKTNGTHIYDLYTGRDYEYSVSLSGYTSKVAVYKANGKDETIAVVLESVTSGNDDVDDTVYGSKTPGQSGKNTIIKEGVYFIGAGSTGTINVNTTGAVTLVGTGISSADMFSDLTIDCVAGANLTIRNLYIQNNVGLGTASGATNMGYSIINFKGSGNSLNFEGTNLLENQEYVDAAGIHLPKGASLTIGAGSSGTLYLFKYSKGAGIGGNADEACGTIEFAGGNIFIKGSKTGPLIGGDAVSIINDPIRISGGTINLVNKAQGAAIGSSNAGGCAGDVYITGGTLTIISDFIGSAIGYGGSQVGGTGNLYVSGGTFKAVRTGNSLTQNGNSDTQTIDDSLVTANKGNLRLLILDKTYTGGGSVSIDGYGTVYAGHDYRYSESTSTMSNWRYENDDSVYLYLDNTKTYTLKASNKTYEIKWDTGKNAFTLTDEQGNTTGGGGISNDAINKEFGNSNVPLSEDPDMLVTIEPEVTNNNGTYTSKVTAQEVTDAVDAADEFNKLGIAIAPRGIPANTKKVAIELPKSSVKEISAAELALVINTPLGNLTFEGDAVAAIVSGAGSGDTVQIIVEAVDTNKLTDAQRKVVGDRPVIDLTVMSGGKIVSSFGDRIIVTIPYEIKNGEVPEGLKVFHLADNGALTEIACTYNQNIGSVIFVLTHFSKYVIMYDASSVWVNPFSDVKDTDWFFDAVKFVSANGLMNGTAATTFAPDANLTRAMLVTVLYRYEKEPAVSGNGGFTDVPDGQWYTDAIAWAAANGIVNGVGDGKFNPNGSITREQLAAILYRYEQRKGDDIGAHGDLSTYTDGAKTALWAADAVRWAVGNGIITGTSASTVDPQGTATRAQVATMLMRYIKK